MGFISKFQMPHYGNQFGSTFAKLKNKPFNV